MAKKGNIIFSDLKKKINKISSLGNHSEMFNRDYSFIHSGNYMLNALLSSDLLGGYPENRIISLSGDKGVGKTFLTLNAIREFQRGGYSIKFYDSEGAINKELVEQFGIDTSDEKFDYSSVSTVEDFRTDITNYIQELLNLKRDGYEIPKMLFILDSAGNLASTKEVTDALSGSDKTDMTRAKILKSVFRIITSKLAEIGATLLFTNHTYRTTDLFSKEVSSGGCLAPNTLVFMRDGSLKEIKDIKVGDYVKTLDKFNLVTNTFEFIKKRYKVIFEDDSFLICSDNHRFLDFENDWAYVTNLQENDLLLKWGDDDSLTDYSKFDLKIKSVEELEDGIVNDITVESVNHYITYNGIINHNSGPAYAASIIVFLSKAQLKTTDGKEKVGVIVSAKTEKNRFARPELIKFHIDFSKGMNPFVGLHEHISWKNCGIENGAIITENDFDKFKTKNSTDKLAGFIKEIQSTEYIINNNKYYFVKKDSMKTFGIGGLSKFAVKHLMDSVNAKDLFTDTVFTEEVLIELQENVIKKIFAYSSGLNSDFDDLLKDENENDNDSDMQDFNDDKLGNDFIS